MEGGYKNQCNAVIFKWLLLVVVEVGLLDSNPHPLTGSLEMFLFRMAVATRVRDAKEI